MRNVSGQAVHFVLLSGGGFVGLAFGLPTDKFFVADFDGDAKADPCAVRTTGTNYEWFILRSGTGTLTRFIWGNAATDAVTPGDYDGDGRTDFALWRSGQAADQTFFFLRRTAGSPAQIEWGQSAGANTAPDYPVANFIVK
jgi:hypothetical protein